MELSILKECLVSGRVRGNKRWKRYGEGGGRDEGEVVGRDEGEVVGRDEGEVVGR